MDSDENDAIDTGTAHSARIYDYIIGGKDHFPADREAGDTMVREWPALPVHRRANRDFMNRAVRHLAREAGIRQFVDIGSGIPTSPNLHEIVQAAAPDARVVYRLLDPLPPGSHLAMSIGTADFAPAEVGRVAREYAARGMPMRLRTRAEAAEFFTGLDLVDPGIVQVHRWRPDGIGTEVVRDEDIAMYGAVARKP
ncbi:SAM-dependent methyltransferase [Streptomyces sp. 3214.6]|uniref:SAM-dependent methyltransferase n=1 Tax=Streptomyces sp. 3214.6 TaxID=1882757 RepID=UPI00090CDAE2|nr:SAM-dependent methyltransferase [Streptomyces sp. 3214.6]SHH82868.1 S-adenosyl methyltransferase [Streptomyces sp. 3214.6]